MKKRKDRDRDFGKQLSRLRKKSRLSSEELARRIGVSPSTYREWENGRAITGQVYVQLARELDVTFGELFGVDKCDSENAAKLIEEIEQRLKCLKLIL